MASQVCVPHISEVTHLVIIGPIYYSNTGIWERFCLRGESHFYVQNTITEPKGRLQFIISHLLFYYIYCASLHSSGLSVSDRTRQEALGCCPYSYLPFQRVCLFPFWYHVNLLTHLNCRLGLNFYIISPAKQVYLEKKPLSLNKRDFFFCLFFPVTCNFSQVMLRLWAVNQRVLLPPFRCLEGKLPHLRSVCLWFSWLWS